MTRLTITTLIILFTINVISQTQMQRYLPSFSGTNSALSTPEGFTLSINPVLISIKSFNDGKRNTIGDAKTINVPVTILGLIYVPKFKLFGASYTTVIMVPIMNMAPFLNTAEMDPSKLGVGNILIQPFGLNWELDDFYIATAYGIHTQTGRYSVNANDNLSRGFWTQMLSLGGTYQFGNDKTWNISAMNRFEFHGKMEGLDLKPGNNWTLDWGFGKSLSKKWAIGLTGYVGRQFQKESGNDAGKDNTKYASQGIGGEVTWFASNKISLQLRGYHDVGKIINVPKKNSIMLSFNWFINNNS